MALEAHVVYALAWASFGIVQSALAREGAKAWLRPRLGAWTRLAYNAIAVVHLGAVFAVGDWAMAPLGGFDLAPWAATALVVVQVVGWVAMLAALRGYDLGRLAGTRPIRAARNGVDEPDDEPLRTDGFHRYVRHPLYSAAFLILIGLADDPFGLATAIWGSVYLVVGTSFEERDLVRRYGAPYVDYRRRVPVFVPWKGRAI